MPFDITDLVVQIALAVIAGAFTIVAVPLRAWIQKRLGVSEIQFLDDIAVIGVRAAESIFERADGPGKLDYATRVAQAELDRRGIKVNAETVRAAIESALVKEFNYGKLIDPPTEPEVVMQPGGEGI